MIAYTKHKETLINTVCRNQIFFFLNCFQKTMVGNFSVNRLFYLPWWVFFQFLGEKGCKKWKSKEHGLNDVAFTQDQNGCISVITYKGNEYQEL